MGGQQAGAGRDGHHGRHLRALIAAALALALGVAVTVGVGTWRARAERTEQQQRLKTMTHDVAASVRATVLRYSDLLVAYDNLNADPALDASRFATFVEETFALPDLTGLRLAGYVARVAPEDVPALEAAQRRAGQPEFRVRDLDPEAELHAVLVRTAPEHTELVGTDLMSDPARAVALLAAAQTGEPTAVNQILTARELGIPGLESLRTLVVYSPVHRRDAPLDTPAQRLAATVGWTAVAVDLDALVADLDLEERALTAAIWIDSGLGERLLVGSSSPAALDQLAKAAHTHEEALDLRAPLSLVLTTTWAAGHAPSSSVPAVVAGGLITALIAAFAVHSEVRYRMSLRARAAEQEERAELLSSRFEAAVSRAPVGVIVVNLSGHVEVVNPHVYALLELPPTGASPDVLDYLQPEDRPRMVAALEALARGEIEHLDEEVQLRTFTGGTRWCRISCSSIHDATGEPVAAVVHIQDVEGERRAAEALRSRSRLFASIVERSSDMIVLLDADMVITWVSPVVARVVGVEPAEVVGHHLQEVVHREDLPRVEAALDRTRAEGTARVEFRLAPVPALRGEERWIETTASNLLDDPDVRAVITISRDVTERRRDRQALAHRAMHDPLTGLLNRDEMQNRIHDALDDVPGEPLTVLYVDLDGFKQVNDQHGHLAGDELLQAASAALLQEVRREDSVARPGGDEFVVLLRGATMSLGLEIAERIRRRLRTPLRVPSVVEPVRISASIGVAGARPEHSVTSLLQEADRALYEAKRRGRDRVEVSTESLRDVEGDFLDLLEQVTRGADEPPTLR